MFCNYYTGFYIWNTYIVCMYKVKATDKPIEFFLFFRKKILTINYFKYSFALTND